jgi:hypothetical protein
MKKMLIWGLLVFLTVCIVPVTAVGNSSAYEGIHVLQNAIEVSPAGPYPSYILPLCQAGTPFNTSIYPQYTPQSDPMVFQCDWDGTERVFISGDKSVLTGVWADDGYTITIQPSGATFDAPEHWGHEHPVVEMTSGMTPGSNTFTLIIQNWMGLSMSYGSFTGWDIDQIPYIVESTLSQPTTVTFNQPYIPVAYCYSSYPPVSAEVSGLGPDQKVNLQLSYQILRPSTLQEEKKYITLDNVGNGTYPITPQMFGVDSFWPQTPPKSEWPANEPMLMKLHFDANLLDPATGNCITQPCTIGSRNYYWNPYGCELIPEFPSIALPITLIIGFLGAVLLIQRTREH